MSNTWKTSNSRTTNYRRSNTGRTSYYGYTYGGGSYGSRGASTNNPNWSPNSPQFNNAKEECECRIGSYENIYTQCSGAGKTSISPATANKFVKFVNNGNYVYKFSNTEFRRFFGNSFKTTTGWTSTTCCRFLQKKFGQGIKAVTRGKGNNWLVCASSNVTARPFTNYTWK